MKLSISNIAWEKENDEEMYKILEEQKYNAIEIAPTRIFEESPYEKLPEAEEFANNLKTQHNLEVSSMQSIWFGKTQKIFESVEEREELLSYTKKAIEFAEKLNCKNLVFGCPKNRNVNKDEDYETAIEFFRKIGNYAKAHNTVFAIEPNPTIYNTNFINTTEQAFEIVRKINNEGVKVNLDLGTVIENKEDIEIINNNLDLINHIHISEPYLEAVEKRELHKELAKILKENNYDKFVSIEMKKGKNIEEIQEIIKYVREVFA